MHSPYDLWSPLATRPDEEAIKHRSERVRSAVTVHFGLRSEADVLCQHFIRRHRQVHSDPAVSLQGWSLLQDCC